MKKTITPFVFALLLSACSPEQLFSLVAKSDVEQASSDMVKQSADTISVVDVAINDKKSQYQESVKLEDPQGGSRYAYAFRNSFSPEAGFSYEIIAVLPPLEQASAYYEGWLIDPQTENRISTGPLFVNSADGSRTQTYSNKKDLTAYTQVIITAQSEQNSEPGPIVLQATFSSPEEE